MEDYEAVVRRMIQHEDELVNQRMTWLLTFNGFLVAALGFAWGRTHATPLITAICVMGIAVSLASAVLLWSAGRAHPRLRKWWQDYRHKDHFGPGVVGCPSDTGPIPKSLQFFVVLGSCRVGAVRRVGLPAGRAPRRVNRLGVESPHGACTNTARISSTQDGVAFCSSWRTE
jgi:hypothetical protein